MQKPVISIIIPCYNVEQYLAYCLDSLRQQTFTDYEAILIDDGSSDGSGKIADEYAAGDDRLRVLHTPNRGVARARNDGIALAEGEYVFYLDSDDLLPPGALKTLYDAAVRTGSDVVVGDYVRIGSDVTSVTDSSSRAEDLVLGNRECLVGAYESRWHGMNYAPWGKLYRKELYTKNGIVFPEGKVHEDVAAIYKTYYFANRITYLDEVVYGYHVANEGSIMHRILYERYHDALYATGSQCDFYKENGENELYDFAVNNHVRQWFRVKYQLNRDRAMNPAQSRSFNREMRGEVKKLLAGSRLKMLKKVIYRALLYVPAGSWMPRIFG